MSGTKAKESETNAINAENDAVKYSNLSKSYAVGTDNTIRENDAEDNAKKYCDTAKSSEVNAKQSETNAKESETKAKTSEVNSKQSETNAKAYLDEIGRKIQATNFEVDFTTGELIQTTDTDYVFTINQTTGNLEWEVTV